MKYVSFDLEIAKVVEGHDWESQRPLGISCAATMTSDTEDLRTWCGEGLSMTPEELRGGLVKYLESQTARGYYILTHNGLSLPAVP